MDAQRKKELKALAKLQRPEMGVFRFLCNPTGVSYIGYAHELKGTLNSMQIRLSGGMFKDQRLLADWKTHGPAAFTIEVLETLPYDADTTKTDYTEELTILRELWLEQIENAEALK